MQKTAFLHYWLTCMRGGENVLEQLCMMKKDADIFTHAVIPEKISQTITSHKITESFIASLPLGRKHCQKYLPLMPFAQKRWNLDEYDLIVSSESGPVKGIVKRNDARHICYCHTPMRYVWDMYDEYYANAGLAGKVAMKLFTPYMRKYDVKSSECVDLFVANSAFVAERIKRIYSRDSKVVYPPVDTEYFKKFTPVERSYYLFAGQLVCYKRPDAVINAFAKLKNEKLLVVGNGPMLEELKRTAPANVEFRTNVERRNLREIYAGAKGLIFPGVEDFGIVPVEAQAANCPVFALKAGGALETVVDHQTGLFFDETTERNILETIEEAKSVQFDFSTNVDRFSEERFRREMSEIIS